MRHSALPLALAAILAAEVPAAAQCEVDRWVASDAGAGDVFGGALAASGDVAVVGAYRDDVPSNDEGSAYVFERSGGVWSETARLTASDGSVDDQLGRTVDVDGDTIVLGAPFHGTGALDSSGAVYVYERTAGTWLEVAKLTASDLSADDYFGFAVAVLGDRIAVGAPGVSATYVFDRVGSVWVEQTKLVAPAAFSAPDLGGSVALQPGRVWAASPYAYGMGAVHLFEEAGGWSHAVELMADTPFFDSQFGLSLAALGDTLLVGSPGYCKYWCEASFAYVFEKQAGSWTQTQRLKNANGEGNSFGAGVDMTATHAVIGRLGWFNKGLTGEGFAHFYERTPGGFVELAELGASDGADGDQFGWTVALAGTDVLVGARFADSPIVNAGAAYAFRFPALSSHYCACSAGAPCGNTGTGPSGCANSAGPGARIATCGGASASADDLVLKLSGMPAAQFGVVYAGSAQTLLPFGDGLRCVAQVILRYPVSPTGGGAFEQPGIASLGGFAAGETRMFQGWFRDPAGPCGGGFNFTDAVEVTFVP